LAYASALIVALVIFAVIALAVVDRAQWNALDRQLESTARALRVVGDVRGGHLTVDAGDREQFAIIAGAKGNAAVIASDGSVAIGSDDRIAQALVALTERAGAPSYSTVQAGAMRVRVFVEPIVVNGERVGATLSWGDVGAIGALDRSVAAGFAVAIPLFVALAVLAGSEIARRGLAPVDRIATLASEIEVRDLSRRLALPARNDELGKLGGTFDRMLDRLQSAFERERRFTSDASHELRAPLSVIRAEADLALRGERTPEEYRRALETIAAESDALEALTRDLLTAARDHSNAEDVRGPVDLALVASAVIQRTSVLAGNRRVRVNSLSGEPAIVQGNRALIERAVLGVLHNALKYSPESGTVEVHLLVEPQFAQLTVSDDGPGFSQTALLRAFDRFWRDDTARGRDGTGLGLALAKTIVERYGGAVALANAEPHGAIVRMTFPAT